MTQEQWLAIQNRDKRYDGKFYVALKTTKIVCRPSCHARTPNPKNVIIFNSLEEALQNGYRLCSRCRPNHPEWQGPKDELAKKAKWYIDTHYTEKFSLRNMAMEFYINSSHLLRCFKEKYNMTLLEYQNRLRIEKSIILLRDTKLSASEIGYEVGYSTLSHFSKRFKHATGFSPTAYRNQGPHKY